MASGGYRVGAGRPKVNGLGKSAPKSFVAPGPVIPTIPVIPVDDEKLPLAYMLGVMNDSEADE
jgi:hypothetical protein